MTNKTIELVFLIDKSGSMRGLERETVRGINLMLNRQRAASGRVLVSTVLFSESTELLHDRIDLEAVRPLTKYDYYTNGSTALMDAIGETIGRIKTIQQYAENGKKPNRTLFIIMTDGYDNASCHFVPDQIRRMIKDQQNEYGWEFLFVGSNIDVIEVASSIGIPRDRTASFDAGHESILEQFDSLSGLLQDDLAKENETIPLKDKLANNRWMNYKRFTDKFKDIIGLEPDDAFEWED